jgi:cyclase
MLAKRIIPCLDVRDEKVVKGVQFKNHRVVGDIVALAEYYSNAGADELVFYDITASCDNRTVDRNWIQSVGKCLIIPFCVAGGIRSLQDAEATLNAGADKISINSPALEKPDLISTFSKEFGQQCVVVGVDSLYQDKDHWVYQYTGSTHKMQKTKWRTIEWLNEVESLGAGEVVLNCMNQDGMRKGYDIPQLKIKTTRPLIASGGVGCERDFLNVFQDAQVDGALAASVFHSNLITIPNLKSYLQLENIRIRS